MIWKKLLGVAVLAVMLVLGGCTENVPPVAPGGPDDAPSEYDGPQLGAILAVTDGVVATSGYEWIGNTFIADGRTGWGAERFSAAPFTLTTYAGHWYSEMLVRDGRPIHGGYTIAGTTPRHFWTSEDYGVFASHMILATDDNKPSIWQWGSNIDSLATHNIEVINRTGHTRLGLVGTATCFSAMPAEVTRDGRTFRTVLWTVVSRAENWRSGNCKVAVVDLDTNEPVSDLVTVKVNGVELVSLVNYDHDRWPSMPYYRYHVSLGGAVANLVGDCWEDACWTFGNALRVTTPFVAPSVPVYLVGDLTGGRPWPMTYVGSGTWERTGITTWVGPQTLQIVTQSGDRVFRTVRWNGEPLHHLTVITLDPNPPAQAFKFTPRHDRRVDQGADNLTVDIDIGR